MQAMKRMRRIAAASVLTLVCVFSLFALVFAATGEAPAALMVPPPRGGPDTLPDGVRVLRWSPGFAIVTSDRSDYVRRLYGKGALLVLPVRKSGCLALKGSADGAR